MDHNTAEDSQESKGRKTPIVIIDIKPNMPLGLLNSKNWRFFDYILNEIYFGTKYLFG